MERDSQNALGVSIALATYNGQAHILEQLESLAAQIRLPVEVVITDDGSTDQTLEIAADFASRAPFPVKIYRNGGRLQYADNFLHAASLCTAPLIAFCDQDDVWRPDKLELSVRFFEDPDVLLSAHTSEVWDGHEVTGKLYPTFRQTGVHEALTLNPFQLVPGFVMVLRRELLLVTDNSRRVRNIFTLGGAPGPMAHDQWAWFLATILGKVATIAEPQALYRQHAANVVGAPKKSGWFYGLTLALREVAYSALAELESEAIRRVRDIAEAGTPAEKKMCAAAIEKLQKRQQGHAGRAVIYDTRSSLAARFRAFTRILLSGGYRHDEAQYSLGWKAAVKDAVFGATGLYKLAGHEVVKR